MVKRDNNMGESELEEKEGSSVTKSHKEIIELLEEIKEFEREYGLLEIEPEFIEVEEDIVEFVEVEPDIVEKIELVDSETDYETQEKTKKRRKFKIKYRTRAEVKKWREKRGEERKENIPATFRIRFDNEGDLVNIDLSQIKKKPKSKKVNSQIKKGEKSEFKDPDKIMEKESKMSKIRRGLSILKRSISQKEETIEEEEESEEEEY